MKFYALLALLLIALATTPGYAQYSPVFCFCDGSAVYIRWQGVRTITDPSYEIIREDLDDKKTDTLKIEDLKRHSSWQDIHRLAGTRANAYVGLFKAAQENLGPAHYQKVFEDAGARNLFNALSASCIEFARVLGEVAIDRSITPAHHYRYTVYSIVDAKRSVIGSSSEIVNTTVVQRVPIPDNFLARSGDQRCTLQWDRSSSSSQSGEVVAWNVYRQDDLLAHPTLINALPILSMQIGDNSQTQSYADEFLTNGKHYYYSVRSINVVGIESSATASFEVIPGSSIQAPQGIHIRELAGNLLLEWAPTIASESENFYRLYRIDIQNHKVSVDNCPSMHSSAVISYIDRDLAPNTTLAYVLQSVRGEEQSELSDTVFFRTSERLSQPRDSAALLRDYKLRGSFDHGVAQLRWEKVADPDVIGFKISKMYFDGDQHVSLMLSRSPQVETSFQYEVQNPDERRLNFEVEAVDRYYNQFSIGTVTITVPDSTPPPAPVLTKAEFHNSVLSVSWATVNVPDFKNYTLSVVDASGKELIKEVTHETHFEKRIDSKSQFVFKVRAVDSSGNVSPFSAEQRFDALAHQAPQSPTLVSVRLVNNSIEFQWTKSSSASVVGYGVWKVLSDGSRVSMAELDAGTLSYVDSISDPMSDQHYIIRAFDAEGNLSADLMIEYKSQK